MKRPVRRLSAEERAMWDKVASTVTPLAPLPPASGAPISGREDDDATASPPAPVRKIRGRVPPPLVPAPVPAKTRGADTAPLDGSWERRIAKDTLQPDFSLDLHGASLDQAYARLMHGLAQARAMGARVVLVVTGKSRPVDAADRASQRGAIRAKLADWLAASEFATDIVALRGAHRRHGGAGAIYVVLRKRR